MTSKHFNPKNKRVLVALSGGVDSAVSAALLKEEGYLVEAGHMVCWDEGPYCTSDRDRADAAKVASYLGMPFHVFDFRKQYRKAVIDYFFSEYEEGRTPNPDLACNSEIKFGIFLQKALSTGYDFVATGHYSRVEYNFRSKQYNLLLGVDPEKDQSYFLYRLTQKELKHLLFPIGHLKKTQVREIALKLGMPNATKKDSQGICFVGNVEVRELLGQKIKDKRGDVITTDGRLIGSHRGLAFYTIGQRQGVGFSEKIPYYVVAKDRKTNTLVVAPFGDPTHFRKGLTARQLSWVGSEASSGDLIQARIRYRQPLCEAKITRVETDALTLEFSEPQKAVTPGQAVVFYREDKVLGGGTISEETFKFQEAEKRAEITQ